MCAYLHPLLLVAKYTLLCLDLNIVVDPENIRPKEVSTILKNDVLTSGAEFSETSEERKI